MTTDDALEYQVLRRLADGPVANQRSLAESLGVSLGKANYVIRALVDRGLVKMENVSRNPNRLGYAYLLTTKGITEKTLLAHRFLKVKLAEYEQIQREIARLAREAGQTTSRN